MNIGSTFAISASGLHAQRLRMDLIAANLANANSTDGPNGGPYKRQDVVLQAVRPDSFDSFLSGDPAGTSVRVRGVVEDQSDPRQVYDPGHPHADDSGHVAMPNVNVMSEMVDLMAATRAYEANIAALDATRRVLQAALEIGQG